MHRDLGVSPRYRATAWQVLFLAQLGIAHRPRVERAVALLISDNRSSSGAMRLHRNQGGESLALTGALLWAVAKLGLADATTWALTWHWVSDEVHRQPVASDAALWLTRAAIAWDRLDLVVDAHLWVAAQWPDPATAPLTFPLALRPDALAYLQMWGELGLPDAPPVAAVDWLLAQRTPNGFWPLMATPGRMWGQVGTVGKPNPWVTVRALAALQRLSPRSIRSV
jgi:hypothetical protein